MDCWLPCNRSAAHSAKWQNLELIFGGLFTTQKQVSQGKKSTKRRKQSSVECYRRSKVFPIRIFSQFPCYTDTQNAACTMHIFTVISAFFVHGNGDTRACLTVWWNLFYFHECLRICCIKLKGHCTYVKSGCVTSVRPSLNPSQFFKKSRATVPLNRTEEHVKIWKPRYILSILVKNPFCHLWCCHHHLEGRTPHHAAYHPGHLQLPHLQWYFSQLNKRQRWQCQLNKFCALKHLGKF